MTDKERYIRDRATVMSIIKYILIVAVTGVLLFFATRIISVLVPFLIGFLLAKTSHAIATPLSRINKKNPIIDSKSRKRLEIIVYVILLLILFIVAGYGIFALIGQGVRAFTAIRNYAPDFTDSDNFTGLIRGFSKSEGGFVDDSFIDSIILNLSSIRADLMNRLPDLVTGIVSGIWGFIGNIPYGVFVVICVLLSGYYFISDGPHVLKMYMKTIPNHSFRRTSLDLINNLSVTLFRALGGYLLLLIITMVEAGIVFNIAGVDYALVLALLTAVLDFLPVLGISATMIPVIVYCISNGDYRGALVVIIGMAVMSVIRRLIEPKIVGEALHLHPLLMLISMAIGVFVWGAVGFLLGPVVFIIVLDVIKVFGIDKKLKVFLSGFLEKFMKPADEEELKTSD